MKRITMPIMPFGVHKGKTLEKIADKDILYLDRIVDFMKKKGMHLQYIVFYEELKEFLKREDISRRIDEAMEAKEPSYDDKPYDPTPKKWYEQ